MALTENDDVSFLDQENVDGGRVQDVVVEEGSSDEESA